MKIVFILIALIFSVQASATPLNKIVVFGDSLSDNGNLYEYMKRELPMSPPYFEGRFTNGPVWIELLTDMYYPGHSQAHLLDYAFGGAGISEEVDDDDDEVLFTLRREVDSYLLTHQDKADDSSLYVVWMGSNNYLAVPEDVDGTVDVVISGIKHDLQRLIQRGAKHFLILNVPDLGRTPAGKDFDAMDLLTELSTKHNALLKKTIDEMAIEDPTLHFLYFDIRANLDELLDSPERFGFTNTHDTCYEEMITSPSEKSILKMVSSVKARANVDACTGYVFFDPVHPSGPTHAILAERVKQMLDDAGVTFE